MMRYQRVILGGLLVLCCVAYYACNQPSKDITTQRTGLTVGSSSHEAQSNAGHHNTSLSPGLLMWLDAMAQSKDEAAHAVDAYQLDVDASGRIGILVVRNAGHAWPRVSGLTWYTRTGLVASGRATSSALDELRRLPGLAYVEASTRLHPARDLGNASVLALPTSFDVKTPNAHSRTYLLKPKSLPSTPADVTIRVYAAYSSKDKKPELLPHLTLCEDAACTKKIDDDVGAYDAKLPAGVVDNHKKPISHARLAVKLSAARPQLYIQVKGLDVVANGRYTLVVSSETLAFLTSDLSGGDITTSKQPQLMGNETARARRNQQVSGQGALVGVIDTGIDWCHPDFLDANGKSRILLLWDQTIKPQPGDVSPDVGNDGNPKNDYGVLYTQQQINAALAKCDKKVIRSVDTSGHGTHVAGIAAASGPIPGVAPQAGLLIVKYTFFSSQQPDAIGFLLHEAKRRNLGIAINMSLGTSSGPKDGSSSQEIYLTGVVGAGKNVIVSAGNAGRSAIHAQGTVKLQESLEVKFRYSRSSSYRGMVIPMYTHPDDTYELTLKSPAGKTYTQAWGGRKNWREMDHRVYLTVGMSRLRYTRVSSFGVIYDKPPTSNQDWSLTIKRTGGTGSGQFDAYVPSTRSNARFRSNTPRNSNGSYRGTVGSPASAPGSLTVASYSMRYVFDTLQAPRTFYSTFKSFGALATSSSRGPLGDGRPGVDIAAPGQYVLSSQSRDRPKDRTTLVDPLYRAISGTSMSAPMVTGAAALVLAKYPRLFVRPLLRTHARAPGCCPTPDETQWGAGLLSMRGLFDAMVLATPPKVKLATKDGVTKGKAPFLTTLVATPTVAKGDRITEYHWDLNGNGFTDEITKTPEITTTVTKGGTLALRVTVFNTHGQSDEATIQLVLAVPPKPEPTSEPALEGGGEKLAPKETTSEPVVVEGKAEARVERVAEANRESAGHDGGIGADGLADKASEMAREAKPEPVVPEPKTPDLVSEPVVEPSRPEQSASEPVTSEPNVDKGTPDVVNKDSGEGKEQGKAPDVPKPGDGCGCSSQRGPMELSWLFLLLGLFGLRRRPHATRQ